jgi:signal transduction histidine kinase
LGAEVQPDHQIRFWVHDDGQGLASDQQARLFASFTQLKQIRITDGHGLGLSIVKRIVEKLNGQVGVESEGISGQGSTFYFTLPANPD